MKAADILDAIRAKYPRAAFVPEVVVDVHNHEAIDLWRDAGRNGPHPPIHRNARGCSTLQGGEESRPLDIVKRRWNNSEHVSGVLDQTGQALRCARLPRRSRG